MVAPFDAARPGEDCSRTVPARWGVKTHEFGRAVVAVEDGKITQVAPAVLHGRAAADPLRHASMVQPAWRAVQYAAALAI